MNNDEIINERLKKMINDYDNNDYELGTFGVNDYFDDSGELLYVIELLLYMLKMERKD